MHSPEMYLPRKRKPKPKPLTHIIDRNTFDPSAFVARCSRDTMVRVRLVDGDEFTARISAIDWGVSSFPNRMVKEYEFVEPRPPVAHPSPVIPEDIDPRPQDPKETNPKATIGVRKVSMSVVPMNVVLEASLGMLEGAAKYGRSNYLASGARASVYFDGTLRHIMDWWQGIDIDPDSGLHHVSKAISSLMVLRACMLAGKFEDDRPPRTNFDIQVLNKLAAEILDKYADKNPRHYTIKDQIKEV